MDKLTHDVNWELASNNGGEDHDWTTLASSCQLLMPGDEDTEVLYTIVSIFVYVLRNFLH